MNHVERFKAAMNGESADRLPMIEWATWWGTTVDRWRAEGLPDESAGRYQLYEYFGLDPYYQIWLPVAYPSIPNAPYHGAGIIKDMDDYLKLKKKHLFPKRPFLKKHLRPLAQRHKKGEIVFWMTLDGFFWFPRKLLGIQRHLYSFYDQPELLHQINSDLLEYHIRCLDDFLPILAPDFMTVGEDMSYNHGPMLSKACFDEFLAPYYRKLLPRLKEAGTIAMVDSDGDVTELIKWLKEAGFEGILPLERMAGVDVAEIRKDHPDWKMIGAFDKTVMKNGEAAMRAEFERLMPVMKTGGFIPAVDHQTPPDVSIETYKIYVSLLREYCKMAVS